MKFRLLLVWLLALTVVASAGYGAVKFMPEFYQIKGKLNQNAYNAAKELGFSTDILLISRVERIFKKLQGDNAFPGHIYVLDDLSVNARSSVEDIYVHVGLINFVKNDDELAGVIAHEMGHIAYHHIQDNYENIKRNHNLLAASVSKAGSAYQENLNIADRFLVQAVPIFSKGQEYEADYWSYLTLEEKGFSPTGLISLFERIQTNSGKTPRLIAWLSTHPPNEKRIAKLKEAIANSEKGREVEAKILAIDPKPFEGVTEGSIVPGYSYLSLDKKGCLYVLAKGEGLTKKKGRITLPAGAEEVYFLAKNTYPDKSMWLKMMFADPLAWKIIESSQPSPKMLACKIPTSVILSSGKLEVLVILNFDPPKPKVNEDSKAVGSGKIEFSIK